MRMALFPVMKSANLSHKMMAHIEVLYSSLLFVMWVAHTRTSMQNVCKWRFWAYPMNTMIRWVCFAQNVEVPIWAKSSFEIDNDQNPPWHIGCGWWVLTIWCFIDSISQREANSTKFMWDVLKLAFYWLQWQPIKECNSHMHISYELKTHGQKWPKNMEKTNNDAYMISFHKAQKKRRPLRSNIRKNLFQKIKIE